MVAARTHANSTPFIAKKPPTVVTASLKRAREGGLRREHQDYRAGPDDKAEEEYAVSGQNYGRGSGAKDLAGNAFAEDFVWTFNHRTQLGSG